MNLRLPRSPKRRCTCKQAAVCVSSHHLTDSCALTRDCALLLLLLRVRSAPPQHGPSPHVRPAAHVRSRLRRRLRTRLRIRRTRIRIRRWHVPPTDATADHHRRRPSTRSRRRIRHGRRSMGRRMGWRRPQRGRIRRRRRGRWRWWIHRTGKRGRIRRWTIPLEMIVPQTPPLFASLLLARTLHAPSLCLAPLSDCHHRHLTSLLLIMRKSLQRKLHFGQSRPVALPSLACPLPTPHASAHAFVPL